MLSQTLTRYGGEEECQSVGQWNGNGEFLESQGEGINSSFRPGDKKGKEKETKKE
jgi:hypothetical protein